MYDDRTQGRREVEKDHCLSQNPHRGCEVLLLPSEENHHDVDPLASFPVTRLSFASLIPSPDLVPVGGSPNVPDPSLASSARSR